ncbi:Gfo/Idh/MocA family protein [Urechidicola croceus]|uniref:Oxidoreductase n=1 Tax=Urechidicola croceus TaxID=1850246 RepID=A0A1D8P579_9FLAO|nr:Gfo/Idh/MocA family oxidoreductase [Urechidicola croceus]AOW19729.1 oxidoreductase [Urechidicola croceus]
MKKIIFILLTAYTLVSFGQVDNPLRIGVVGLTHTHVHWLLGGNYDDVQIVGIVETNKDLAKRYTDQHNLSMDIVFDSMDEMIEKSNIEAVAAFGSIYEHLEVVEKFAPLGIHIMVEKPLAVSNEHALKMKSLAKKHNIHLLTNYETTWYATNYKAYEIVQNDSIGNLRKIVVHDGHQGPIEIGVNQEFLDWLLDPIQNGGGALTDFGCYGANLITWFMNGEKPISVTAFTQQIKPDLYPNVDDDATIILQYSKTQGIIQASWNWPFNRKDMELYGETGYVFSDNGSDMRIRLKNDENEKQIKIESRLKPFDNPFSYFGAIIRGKIKIEENDLSSLENNMIVVEILEAAKESAKTGKTIYLN